MPRTRKPIVPPLPSVTPTEIERGRAFAAWLDAAIQRAGTNAFALSKMPGTPSVTYIYWLLADGISNIGEYKRPSEEVIHALAHALNADENQARKLAGYDSEPSARTVVPDLAALPMELQYDIVELLQRLRGAPAPVSTVRESPSLRPANFDLAPTPPLVNLPVMGFAGAVGEKFNIFAEEHQEGEIALPLSLLKGNDPERCFIVRVRGNCLRGSLIADGDYAICVAADTAQDWQVVLVADGDDAVLKRYREVDGVRWLETDEASGERNEYVPDGPAHIMARMIALHREL